MNLILLPDRLAVCRFDPGLAVPDWATARAAGGLWSLTRTAEELSLVCAQEIVPDGVMVEAGWRAFMVAGPLDFALVGILAELAGALARAGISLFAISTYDTDYVLVKSDTVEAAAVALRAAGHRVEGSP